MNNKRLASNLVVAGGVVELIIALLHFVWHIQLVQTGEFARLSTDYINFIVLNCIAVGLCLTIFGVLSIYSAQGLLTSKKWAWFYGISQGILWIIRALLEVVFPVHIPLFFVNNPTLLVLPLTVLLGLLFLISTLDFPQGSHPNIKSSNLIRDEFQRENWKYAREVGKHKCA